MRRIVFAFAGLVVWGGLLCGSAPAQTSAGIIEGVIRDVSGGALPGVALVVASPALIQASLTVTTNDQGYYRAAGLPPGTYSLTTTLQGFKSVKREGLILRAGQTLTIDLQLDIASVEETVTVIGESPIVDTRSAKLAFNYTEELLQNVPTQRNFHDMVSTIPGVETANPYGTAPGNLANESVLGAGPFGNRYTMDGGNVTDPTISVNQANLFSYDIIEEVQVLKGAKPAEVGFSQGGFFNIVTKSGGNKFSGSVSFHYQGDGTQSENLNERLRSFNITRSNELLDDFDFSATAGGRIVADRLWWFGSYRRQDRVFSVLGFPQDINDEVNAYFWKNTFQLTPKNRLSAMFNRWDQTVDLFFFAFSPAFAAGPEVSMLRKPGGNTFQFNWDGVLGDNLTATAGFGWNDFDLHQLFQPNAGVATIDLVTQRRFGNPGNGGRISTGTNWDWVGSLSWFVPDAAGRHDLKLGMEYTHSPFDWGFTHINDHTLRTSNGAPEQVFIVNTPVDARWLQKYASVYAQDSWTVKDRLTLNLGVRFDRIEAITPEQSSGGGFFSATPLADQFPELKRISYPAQDLWAWNSLAPRVAASYEVDERGRTVLKAGFGRYYHHLSSQQVWSVNQNFPRTLVFRWSDLNGDRQFQVGEQGTLLARQGGGTVRVDPDVHHPYSDELSFGVSRELVTDFSVGATFVYRKDKDLVNLVEVGIPFDSYRPVSVPDPEGGALTVFAQDPATFGRNQQIFTNPDRQGFDNGRTYKGLELVANKRFSNKWQFVGSLVISAMDVVMAVQDAGGAIGSEFLNPNNQINRRGEDPLNQTYQLKLQGSYQAPYGIVLSALHRYGSGLPFTRELVVRGLPQGTFVVFAEPRGSRETDSYNWLDLRIEKTFEFSGKARLGLILDYFNLTNAATVLQEGTRTGINLGTPLVVRTPRIARVGLRLNW